MKTLGMRMLVGSAAAVVMACCGGAMGVVDVVREDRAARNGAEAMFFGEHPQASAYRGSSGRITSLYGPGLASGGNAVENATWFMLRHAEMFGAEFGDLVNRSRLEDGRGTQGVYFDRATGRDRFTLVYFSQVKDGFDVFRGEARVLARNEAGSPVVMVRSALRDVSGFKLEAGYETRLIGQRALHEATIVGGPGFVNFSAAQLVIWAGVEEQVVRPRLAFEFSADNGKVETEGYAERLFVVDAFSGEVLHHESLVHALDVTGTARGNTTNSFRADTCDPEVPIGLPYLTVTMGSVTATADAQGNFTIPTSGPGPFTLNASVVGRYFRVTDSATAVETLTIGGTPGSPADFMFNAANTSEFRRAEMNAYVYINRTRDLILAANPTYPTIAGQVDFGVLVNEAGSCNAFYGNNSVRFYRAGGGCANMTIPTVVAHEYGHHLVQTGGSGQGAYGEGMGDTLGVLLSDDPISGAGYNGNCNTGGRTAVNNLMYPCGGGSHACAPLMSGCVWNTRNALVSAGVTNYRQVLNSLAVNAVLLHTGTAITPEITADYLTLDDDDGNIFNGTPHYPAIATGFGSHNMQPPTGVSVIGIAFPDGRPERLSSFESTSFRVLVRRNTVDPAAGSAMLTYDIGAGPVTAAMTQGAANEYTAVLPAAPCGTMVSYYITASASTGVMVSAPDNTPASTFLAVSATDTARVWNDPCESAAGWSLVATGDTATSGRWVQGDPLGSTSQADFDRTADGVNCYYTGVGTADVDGGMTTLTTPAFNLMGVQSPRISYWRWYSNAQQPAPGQDVFTVQISNDDGQSWSAVETVGPTGPETRGGWIQHEFAPNAIVTPTATMRLRFVASDTGTDSTIEAAVDDVVVQGFICTNCPTDWNHNGLSDTADFYAFIVDFFNGNADYDGSGTTDSVDFFLFLDDYLMGCG